MGKNVGGVEHGQRLAATQGQGRAGCGGDNGLQSKDPGGRQGVQSGGRHGTYRVVGFIGVTWVGTLRCPV